MSTFTLPDFSSFDQWDFNVRDEDLLCQLAAMALALQVQLNAIPALFTHQAGAASGEDMLDVDEASETVAGWSEIARAWWASQAKPVLQPGNLGVQILKLIEVEARTLSLFDPAGEARIVQLLPGSGQVEVGQVSLQAGEMQVALPGCIVLSQALERVADADEDFLLYGPRWGIKYEQAPQRAAVQLRDYLREQRNAWVLPEEQRLMLTASEQVTLVVKPLEQSLASFLVADLEALQAELLERLLKQARQDPAQQCSIADLQAAVTLDLPCEYLQERVTHLIARQRKSSLPDWLRNLASDERQRLSTLQQALASQEQQLQKASRHFADFDSYAAYKVRSWLNDHHGVAIDPGKVSLTVRHAFTSERASLTGQRSCTLLEWVQSGGYQGNNLQVEVIDDVLRQVISAATLQQMVSELDLRTAYAAELEEHLQTAEVKRVVGEGLDTQLALSVQMRQHWRVSQETTDLLLQVLDGDFRGNGISAHWVTFNGAPLRRHLCLLKDGLHVLYAPGSPAGDLQAFASPRQLYLSLGASTSTAEGRGFLLERTPAKVRQVLDTMIELGRRKASEWPLDDFALLQLDAEHWQQVREALVEDRIAELLEDASAVCPQWLGKASKAQLQRMSDLENELRSLCQHYQALTKPVAFREYAHQQVSARINQQRGRQGLWLDPDRLMVRLDSATELTLTQLVIEGYPASLNFEANASIRSLDGLDVAHLHLPSLGGYIRAARLGEKYIQLIEQTYLDKQRPDRDQQLELHRLLLGLKMQRDIIAEILQGHLSAKHATWLSEVCRTFAEGSFVDDCLLSELALNGCRVEGAYVLHDPAGNGSGSLIYLSDAPGGRHLLTPLQMAKSWRTESVGDYMLGRVAFKDIGRIVKLNDQQRRSNDAIEVIIAALGVQARILDMRTDFHERARRMIMDVDDQTTSAAERVSNVVVEWGITVATLIAFPFPPAALTIGLLLSARSFFRGIMAWRQGDTTTALLYGALTVIGIAGAAGLGNRAVDLLAKGWNRLFPGPSGVFMQRMKALIGDYGWPVLKNGSVGTFKGFDQELLWLVNQRPAM